MLDLSPYVSDEIRKTTCYMCACRCGVDVHVRDGRVRYLQGNRDHPVNRGVLCAKGSAGMLHQESPARLRAPLLRSGERGKGTFQEISWDHALGLATEWLAEIRQSDPSRLGFFTGRDQSQALTGWWAQQFGTPNHAAHGGFCSVNMAAGGIYSIGGSFWEFGQPDWDRTKLLLLFGVAEDHDSNPLKIGLAKLRRNGVRIISVNPVCTGYSAIADNWLGITPGSDGLLIMAILGELLRSGSIDAEALRYTTNAPWLITLDAGAHSGLFVRDRDGTPMIWDAATNSPQPHDHPTARPHLSGRYQLDDGRAVTPVFTQVVHEYLQPCYRPEAVAERTGIGPATIRWLAAEIAGTAFGKSEDMPLRWTDWRGIQHASVTSRPVAIHAMRGIAAHGNGFQTCRALHVLQMLIGSVDAPGGTRYKAPYPKPVEMHPRPSGLEGPGLPLQGPPLGYPLGPEDLLVNEDGSPQRIDKAYSWEAPLAAHGLLHMAIPNACAGDPYDISVLMIYMANLAWNSSMNTPGAMNALTARNSDGSYRIPRIIVSDAFASEMVDYADLVLPDTTYLERYDCISLLDRPIGEADHVGDAIRHPVLQVNRDVRPFQDVLIDLGNRLELPGFTDADGTAKWSTYREYMALHERKPGIGPLAGWRGADGSQSLRGAANPEQIEKYIANGGFWTAELPEETRYYRNINMTYQDWAADCGLLDEPSPFKLQLYSEPLRKFQLAAEGFGPRQPPEDLRERIRSSFNPLPNWYDMPASSPEYPYHAITQRPMAMYHSWGTHNPWLRQIHSFNRLYIPSGICDREQLEDDDWIWLESDFGRIRTQIKRMHAVNSSTVWTWNAIARRSGSWRLAPGASESRRGFLLNHLISELLPKRSDAQQMMNSDPVTGQAAWYDLRVQIRKAPGPKSTGQQNAGTQTGLPDMEPVASQLRYGSEWTST
ncbi:MAG: molybdopterin-dependent oxidoreductase [Rhodobacteraceae bacterium]|nr:molybdopterin-dependent oxidoreductase [Paracoccaceae bacterium]